MTITRITRRNIIDVLTISEINWYGRLDDVEFLSRIYNLQKMGSNDYRFKTADGDIHQHRINNNDWDNDWVFYDARFDLQDGPDEKFLQFLAETIHPVVRPDQEEAAKLLELYNSYLRVDGWEIYHSGTISGKPIYSYRKPTESSVLPEINTEDRKKGTTNTSSAAISILPKREYKPPVENTYISGEYLRIIFLAADPRDASRLRLGEEHREIQDQLRKSANRDKIVLVGDAWSVRPQDFSQILLDKRPNIVHFSGHGTSAGEICIEDKTGNLLPVSPRTLGNLFLHFKNTIVCVILNACYSRAQAEAINQHIKFVIGMNTAISDEAAIAFSVGFYQALGAGQSVENAFDLGVVQIGLNGYGEENIPELLVG